MSGNIFISYRRDDAAAWAGRLHMALEKHFRREQLFMDVDSIQAGLDFARVIDAEVAKCDVMLVVIGKGWLDARDASGRRRLDDPGDFVRLEVESALRRDIRVVPVLVDGASLPKAEELPEGMRGLERRQAWPLSHARFGPECEGLIATIPRFGARHQQDDLAASLMKGVLYSAGGVGLILAVGWLGQQGPFKTDLSLLNPAWAGFGGITASLVLVVSTWQRATGAQLLGLWVSFSVGVFAAMFYLFDGMHNATPVLLFTGVSMLLSGPALYLLWRKRRG